MSSDDYDQEEDEQHDPNSEPVPPLPQYQPAFAQAETVASATIHKVSMHVADEPDQDSESMYMHERLVTIERPAYPSPVRVAICGSSDIGKSTMINAIFGFPLCPTVSVHSLVLGHCSQISERQRRRYLRAYGALPRTIWTINQIHVPCRPLSSP